ncbi:Dibenzothiophene desulfurization enzyme A [Gluconacetobacter sp. SXCC-1]|uniref:LLM class flavin-dependent oxidoreductase n=1 Tax=Komagataeibacter rhaeticus TaxID=215221 RepID=UPI000207FB70|nr:LLM class flavin-dependent oxidoreductase [Komagataeibacter rhaeticus]ATU71514.1 LLM class flavin-dependent oxidoreductase [Komagataeibacter xylinus]EGG78084.1 Dibenzothiophene desulfurization enzyme A [Gluconacetobacter sp. SXCC-1]WPP21179.1 LLM class flavin-dependent oxidoreductase [Komagataeibacter rhaeticus]
MRGRFIKTRGPLSIPRSSQDHPVLMQAGSSPRGVEFGARWAELIFAIPAAKDIARKNYDTLKAAMVARGRAPEDCAVAMQATCIVGETDSIAREKAAFVNQLARHELTRATLSANSGIDVSRIGSTTGPVEGPAGNQGMHAAINEVSQMARSGMLMDNTKQPSAYLPKQIVGSPTTVADALEDLFVSGCCDGFVLTPVTFPGSHEAFARSVVPELQRRGLFRTRYEGTTLRENLGTRPGW